MIEFLEALWPKADLLFGELRALGSPSGPQREFFPLGKDYALESAVSWAAYKDRESFDVYFGVLPRVRRSGTNEDVAPKTRVLWADIDSIKNDRQKEDTWRGLMTIAPKPSIVVDSGNGYHAYWLLAQNVSFPDARLAMKGLAQELGADKTYDAARILRVPGTRNWKSPMEAKYVRLIRFEPEREYDWEMFSRYYDAAADRGTPMSWSRPRAPRPREGLPDWLAELIVYGAPRGQRSEASFKVAVWLMRYGWTDEEIEQLFHSYPEGIGEKYHEKGAYGPRWLDYTLRAAREAS